MQLRVEAAQQSEKSMTVRGSVLVKAVICVETWSCILSQAPYHESRSYLPWNDVLSVPVLPTYQLHPCVCQLLPVRTKDQGSLNIGARPLLI